MSADVEYDPGSLRRAASLLRHGSVLVLLLLLVALTLTVFASYQSQAQRVHNLAFDRIVPAHEALERQGALMAAYLQRLAAWQEDQPALVPGKSYAADGAYRRQDLLSNRSLSQVLATAWLRTDAAASALTRAASILNLADQQQRMTPVLGSIWLFDRHGSLFASYPPVPRATLRQRALAWSQTLPSQSYGELGWAIQPQSDAGCGCLLAYTRLSLPGATDSLLSQAVPLQQLHQLFDGQGWFALLDQQHRVVYASAGAEPQFWQRISLPATVGVSEIAHQNGKIMVQRRLRYLPWTLVYSPSRQGESGREWFLLLWHVLSWLAGAALLLWGYVALRRLLLAPNEAALRALQAYQQQLKDNNQQLRIARDQAEQANQARALFLAVMSHEIRTPLNGVMAMLELLGREPLGEVARRELDMIQSSSELLLRVITDILDFTRIQSGKVEFSPEPVCLLPLVENVLETQRAALQISAKAVSFVLEAHLDRTIWLLLDPFRLRQVLGNLLSNALKFTEQGQVILQVGYDGSCLQLAVRDSGIGMNDEQLARLFQPFTQAEASTSRHYGGSGLGLAIIKGLIDQAGGRIEVESQPGEGSVFRVQLPCLLVDAPEPAALADPLAAPSTDSGAMVWVVEDHPINQATLQAQFRALGVEARFSSSGAEALAQLPHAQNVALILTDISMPGMDGYQFTAQLKADAVLGAIPVVALSAHAFASDVERSRQQGMAGYLTKPVRLAELAEVLQRFGVAMHVPPVPAQAQPLPAEEGWLTTAQLEMDSLLQMFSGDLAQVRPFVEHFLQCDRDDLAGLQQALTSEDRNRLLAQAHRMGSAALYLDPAYADRLYTLEETALDSDWDDLAQQVGDIVLYSRGVAAACRLWLQETAAKTSSGGEPPC